MDPDAPPVELPLFSAILPLPYRLASLVVLGVWLWGMNLHWLAGLKIDVHDLIRYSSRPTSAEASYLTTYRLATFLTVPLAISLLFFWVFTAAATPNVLGWSILPNSYLFLLLFVFIVPIKALSHSGRGRFLSTLKRVSVGGLARSEDGKFGDVLLADALTSYAKPLSEVYVVMCMFVTGKRTTDRPDRDCGAAFVVPFLMAVPFWIRLRQCITDRQPANALKYASAFPAIILSAAQKDPGALGVKDTSLFRLWFLAVLVNTLYSFYWDVQRDWDLTLLSSARANPEHPYGLRRVRIFKSTQFYYAMIVADLFLRFTWSLKLSVHILHFNDIEGGLFLLELFEVFRRWMWAFLRIEAEWIRSRHEGDVLLPLDDIAPYLDED